MSQQAAFCHNKDQAELNLEDKLFSLSQNSIATQRTAEKLCQDKRQLCRNTKFRVSAERQDNFVAIEILCHDKHNIRLR